MTSNPSVQVTDLHDLRFKNHPTYEPQSHTPMSDLSTPSSTQRPALEEALISIVLPVYNEAEVLHTLVTSVRKQLDTAPSRYEIVFVNDGSNDRSSEILDELAEKHHNVRVIHFARNFGHQAAVQAGLNHARGDAVVLMDSDMQDAPAAILRFIEKWQEGYDVVYAIRRRRKENLLKRCLFSGFHQLMGAVSSCKVPIDAGNFGLMDRRVVRQVASLGEYDRYLPGLRSWVGFRQTGVEVERGARYDGKPRVSMRGLIQLAKTAIFSFSSLPLAIFYAIGFFAFAVFSAVAGYAMFCRVFTDLAVPGWTSQLLVGSFFGAVNALGISILGEYVTRIYDQVRQRPLYVVDRATNLTPAIANCFTTSKETTMPENRQDDWREQLWEDAELDRELTDEEMEEIWNDPLLKEAAELLAMMDDHRELEPSNDDLQKIESANELADLPEVLRLNDHS
jgi:glycosyltransferase involved in cell wall biosynthesis